MRLSVEASASVIENVSVSEMVSVIENVIESERVSVNVNVSAIKNVGVNERVNVSDLTPSRYNAVSFCSYSNFCFYCGVLTLCRVDQDPDDVSSFSRKNLVTSHSSLLPPGHHL